MAVTGVLLKAIVSAPLKAIALRKAVALFRDNPDKIAGFDISSASTSPGLIEHYPK